MTDQELDAVLEELDPQHAAVLHHQIVRGEYDLSEVIDQAANHGAASTQE